jgi:hypothetical protein
VGVFERVLLVADPFQPPGHTSLGKGSYDVSSRSSIVTWGPANMRDLERPCSCPVLPDVCP